VESVLSRSHPRSDRRLMAKPLTARQHDLGDLIASAVRTLEAEAGGINALTAAIHDGLGEAFTAAIDLIRGASGRVIVTGMGQSGHVRRKVAATLAPPRPPRRPSSPPPARHAPPPPA